MLDEIRGQRKLIPKDCEKEVVPHWPLGGPAGGQLDEIRPGGDREQQGRQCQDKGQCREACALMCWSRVV